MKKIYLLLLFFLPLVGRSSAQRFSDPKLNPYNYSEIMGLKDMNLLQRTYDLSKYKTLDTCTLSIFYLKTSIQDTIKRESVMDTMCLRIGTRYSVFFSNNLYRMDSIYTAHNCEKQFGGIGCLDGGIYYYDNKLDRLQVVQRIPFVINTTVEYIEQRLQLDWEIQYDSITTLCGFKCIQATTFYGGRQWNVWFTPELPINMGPWKFSGLPGLILKAVDSREEYIFEFIGISQERIPIRYYLWKTRMMNRGEWLKYDSAMHQHPYDYVGNGGQVLFLHLSESPKKPYLDEETWIAPYNPIELE